MASVHTKRIQLVSRTRDEMVSVAGHSLLLEPGDCLEMAISLATAKRLRTILELLEEE